MTTRSIILITIFLILLIVAVAMVKPQIIYNVTDILPKGPGEYDYRDLNRISDITIHHSATPTGTASSFARYHTGPDKGWPGIGYHFVIYSSGRIEQTNELTTRSYHNGFNNTNAIGICLIGNFEETEPTNRQLDALDFLIPKLKKQVPAIKYLVGHKEYEGETSCPGRNFPMTQLREKHKLPVSPRAKYPIGGSIYSGPIAFGRAIFESRDPAWQADN